MRLSEIEENSEDRGNIGVVHQDWLQANTNIDPQIADDIKTQALLFFNKDKNISAASAHAQGQMRVNRAYDKQQDQRYNQKDKKGKFKTGIAYDKDRKMSVTPDGKVKTGADGRQLRHDRWHGNGQGKNAKQLMIKKWKEFQKSDGLLGKDVAKGDYIVKAAGEIGKGIVAMGNRARDAGKRSSN